MDAANTRPSTRAPARSRVAVDKFNARRIELAEAALATLAQLGYARTSLREIAQKSEFSHGVLHYYFADKTDLICCGVRQYKATCITRYDEILATAHTREELVEQFLRKLEETLRIDGHLHRLWYDMRAQSMFETAFRDDVNEIDGDLQDMVWRVIKRYAELGNKTALIAPNVLYALFDGLFQRSLLRHLSGDDGAIRDFQDDIRRLLPMIA